jgi:hypothetical protein
MASKLEIKAAAPKTVRPEAPEKAADSVSAIAMQLYGQQQEPGFQAGVEKFLSLSPEEMGEIARRAAASRKAAR